MNGQFLIKLGLADDAVLLSETLRMVEVGLKIIRNRIKVMFNNQSNTGY